MLTILIILLSSCLLMGIYFGITLSAVRKKVTQSERTMQRVLDEAVLLSKQTKDLSPQGWTDKEEALPGKDSFLEEPNETEVELIGCFNDILQFFEDDRQRKQWLEKEVKKDLIKGQRFVETLEKLNRFVNAGNRSYRYEHWGITFLYDHLSKTVSAAESTEAVAYLIKQMQEETQEQLKKIEASVENLGIDVQLFGSEAPVLDFYEEEC